MRTIHFTDFIPFPALLCHERLHTWECVFLLCVIRVCTLYDLRLQKPRNIILYSPFHPKVSDPELATYCYVCPAVDQGPSSVRLTQSHRFSYRCVKKQYGTILFKCCIFNFIKNQANIFNISNALIHISICRH